MLQQFVVASDSKQVVGDVNSGNRGRYGTVISEIQQRASMFNCIFTFESRESNYEAHSLAKISHSLGGTGRYVWLGYPHDPRCIPQTVEFDQ